MSTVLTRASMLRLVGLLVCGQVLMAAAGCQHAPSTIGAIAPVERLGTDRLNDERQFPGVQVVRNKRGGFHVHVFSGRVSDGESLYIIDGEPMMINPNRGIDWIAVEDIAQIKVLKSPDETVVYGPRGANGVIVLTTRRAASRKRGL